MEIALILISAALILLYILRPITKSEEKAFRNKDNWRGGF